MKHRTLMILHFLTIQTLKYLVKTLEYKSINVAYVILCIFVFKGFYETFNEAVSREN